jgi:uncharacterized protein (TIGR02145 family)
MAMTPITRNTTGATGIGAPTGLPDGVTASWSNNVITISGTPTATGSSTYTIPLTGGCGSVNATGTITVTVFTCGTTTVSDIDGNTYNTVAIIGTSSAQCWTKENLRVRRYNDGTWIRFDNSGGSGGNDSGQTWSGTGLDYGAHTIYSHDSTATTGKLAIYGYLYNWYAAKGVSTSGSTTYKNICPTGWHVPTDAEWVTLKSYLGSSAGTVMKKNDALWGTNTGTNTSGFSALPGGLRYTGIGFFFSDYAIFWSATQLDETKAVFYSLNSSSSDLIANPFDGRFKSFGNSVRCLKD